jgi:hypothetical protein
VKGRSSRWVVLKAMNGRRSLVEVPLDADELRRLIALSSYVPAGKLVYKLKKVLAELEEVKR